MLEKDAVENTLAADAQVKHWDGAPGNMAEL
jgi:hypothetical protein